MTPTEAAAVLTTHYRQHTKTCGYCEGYSIDSETGRYFDCRTCGNTGRVAKTQNDLDDEYFTLAVETYSATRSEKATHHALMDVAYIPNIRSFVQQAMDLVNSRGDYPPCKDHTPKNATQQN